MTANQKNNDLPLFSSFQIKEELVWQMSRSEKYALISLLELIRPNASLEIGTYRGGSLQVISHFSKKVYSIDISPEPKKSLSNKFNNVEFLVEPSSAAINKVFKVAEEKGERIEFVLIDGDHSRKGVYSDLKAVLDYPHKSKIMILLHDSYNPQCRKGMLDIDFKKYQHIEYAEIDYITGSFWHNGNNREMWGGLALIKVNPDIISSPKISQSAKNSFKVAKIHSIHMIKDPLKFLSPIKKAIYRRMKWKHREDTIYNFEK